MGIVTDALLDFRGVERRYLVKIGEGLRGVINGFWRRMG